MCLKSAEAITAVLRVSTATSMVSGVSRMLPRSPLLGPWGQQASKGHTHSTVQPQIQLLLWYNSATKQRGQAPVALRVWRPAVSSCCTSRVPRPVCPPEGWSCGAPCPPSAWPCSLPPPRPVKGMGRFKMHSGIHINLNKKIPLKDGSQNKAGQSLQRQTLPSASVQIQM